MAKLVQQLRFRNHICRVFLFGCALTLATIVSAQDVAATTITICKKTVPQATGTSFTITGANGWTPGTNKDFTYLYPPNPFQLVDGQCSSPPFDTTANDKFNKFTETVPSGWTLTNITCTPGNQVVRFGVSGSAINHPMFQPGDNTVALDQNKPAVTCTFWNTRGKSTCAFNPKTKKCGGTCVGIDQGKKCRLVSKGVCKCVK